MNNLIITTVIMIWLFIVESVFDVFKLHKRRHWDDYIALFLVILGTCYAAQAYGKERINLRHPILIEQEMIDWDLDTEECEKYLPEYAQHYFVMKTNKIQCKFVPQGTAERYVNEDGSPSDLVWKSIRMCDHSLARESLRLHREKCQEFFWEADRLCVYLPETTSGHKMKALFSTYMASIPTSGAAKVCVIIIGIITQYGLDVYDEYERVMFNLNMCKWHYNVSKMFEQYIEEKGW